MSVMAPERKKKKPGRPKGRIPSVSIQARVPPALHHALEQLAAKTRRTRNAELVLALEAHLAAAGMWPPARQEG